MVERECITISLKSLQLVAHDISFFFAVHFSHKFRGQKTEYLRKSILTRTQHILQESIQNYRIIEAGYL
jgi:hypothetical protein